MIIDTNDYKKIYRGEKPGFYVLTGEFRPPLKGEFFLSGSFPCAYEAFADMSGAYYICRSVTSRERTNILKAKEEMNRILRGL